MTQEQIIFIHDVFFNSTLKEMIKSEDVRKVIAAQFALESNYGKSPLAKNNHNFCGMKHAEIRPTFSLYEKNGYAYYINLNQCIKDYIIWIFWNKPNKLKLLSSEYYLTWLESKNYAEDKEYCTKIAGIYNQIKQI